MEAHFAWLDSVKLEMVLKRLREHDLLVWDNDARLYALAPAGRMVRALSEEGFDDDAWRLAQEIGARQSEMMRMSSIFQWELAAIARQRVGGGAPG